MPRRRRRRRRARRVRGAVQLGESAVEIPGRRQGHAERVSGVTLVAGRSGSDGRGDRLGGAPTAACSGRSTRSRASALAARTRARAAVGRRRPGRGGSPARRPRGRRRPDRAAAGTSRAARGGSRRERRSRCGSSSARASATSWAARSRSPARLATSAARSTISARDTGRSARAMLVVVECRQQPVVVALRLRQRVGQLGVDRRGERRGDGAVAAPGGRPVMDEGRRPARRRRAHGRSRSPGRRRRGAPARSPGSSSPSTASWTRAWRKA